MLKHTDCRHCAAPIVLASCSDGRVRGFNPQPEAVTKDSIRACWAWRTGKGMEAGDPLTIHWFPREGLTLHFCAEYAHWAKGKTKQQRRDRGQ